MNRSVFFKKLQDIIDKGIQICIVTEDRAMKDLKLFRRFLYRNLKKYEY